MSNVSIYRKAVFAVAAVFLVAGGVSAKGGVEPTHYLFVPTARVNHQGEMVLGLHEISYGLGGKLQLQTSILDNIGRLNLAAKYGFHRNLAGGVGMAWTFVPGSIVFRPYLERGHGIKHQHDPGVGGFLAYEFGRPHYGLVLTGHAQLAYDASVGADIGGRVTPSKTWAFLWDAGISLDLSDGEAWLYGIGGLRFNLAPSGLFIDVGLQAVEFKLSEFRTHPGLFFDVMYCFKP